MTQSKIYRRLFAPYVLILLTGLGGAWLAATILFSETLEKRLQQQLTHTVQLLSNGVIPYTPTLIQKLSRLIRAEIVMLDSGGQISISTLGNNQSQLQNNFFDSFELNRQSGSTIIQFKSLGEDYLLALNKVTATRDSRVIYIAVFASLSDIQSTNQRIASWLWFGALLGLFLLAWIGHHVSRSITLPIKELAKMASQIAQGNRSIRAKIHQKDEIGELATALNSMAKKLKDYDQEITKQSRLATLGKMTARIAHEIRNPLTAIKMQLQLLKETTDTSSTSILDNLLDETRRLELIVLSTLQHKKIAAPVLVKMNMNKLIEEIVQLLRLQFEHQGLQVTLQPDPDLQELSIDRDMMTQILLNLLLNAKDEMPEGGKIQLTTGNIHNNEGIWFAVDDSGPGIAENHWQTLFLDSDSIKPGGFGLGLRLCRELAEIHHGKISISKSQLGGACFTVTLPQQIQHK